MLKKYSWTIFILPFLWNCSENSTSEEKLTEVETLVTDSTENTSEEIKPAIPQFNPQDDFENLILLSKDSLTSWGFVPEGDEPKHLKSEDYARHWYLRHYFRTRPNVMDTLPSRAQMESMSIRQMTFKKNWKWIIEEWQFETREESETWLYIIQRNYRIDDGKPPRVFWLNENRLYFIVATAAVDWEAYKERLLPLITQCKPNLVKLLTEPLNIVEFKKKKGGSNSSAGDYEDKYKPDSEGFHYFYTLFNTPRSLPETIRFRGLYLYTYKFGKYGGDYFDENELLVGVKATYADPDLGLLDWVGRPIQDFEQLYGSPQLQLEDKSIYFFMQRALVLIHADNNITEVEYFVSPKTVVRDMF